MQEYGVVEALSNGIKPRWRVSFVHEGERVEYAAVDDNRQVWQAVDELRLIYGPDKAQVRVWDTELGEEVVIP